MNIVSFAILFAIGFYAGRYYANEKISELQKDIEHLKNIIKRLKR